MHGQSLHKYQLTRSAGCGGEQGTDNFDEAHRQTAGRFMTASTEPVSVFRLYRSPGLSYSDTFRCQYRGSGTLIYYLTEPNLYSHLHLTSSVQPLLAPLHPIKSAVGCSSCQSCLHAGAEGTGSALISSRSSTNTQTLS